MDHGLGHVLNLDEECLLGFQPCLVMVARPLELVYDRVEGGIGPRRPLQALRNSELLAVYLLCHTANLGGQLLREYLVQGQPRRQKYYLFVVM